MTRVLFVATVDPTGRSGKNIATKEVIAALLRRQDIELTVIVPLPDEPYRTMLRDRAHRTVFLPASKPRSLWRQLELQFLVPRAVAEALGERLGARGGRDARGRPPEPVRPGEQASPGGDGSAPPAVVTRMGNLLTLPRAVRRRHLPFYVLVRGLVSTEIKRLSRIPGLGGLWNVVLRLHCRAARQVYVAYREIAEAAARYRTAGQDPPIVFPNAVDPELFPERDHVEARRRLNLPWDRDSFVVGFVGSLQERHLVHMLLDAVAAVSAETPRLRLLVVGDGPERNALQAQAEHAGIADRVLFTGFVPHERIGEYMAACDLLYGLVDPLEPQNPIKCYEYLAAARPIISSKKEELAFVEHQDLGFIVADASAALVAEAIRAAAERTPAELLEMGRRGRRYVLTHHTWDQLVSRILADYERLREDNSR